MLDFVTEKESAWQVLKNTAKPVVLYGMGNGADKILDWCEANGVQAQGVFASDEFVRGQRFRGFTVERYDALKARLGNDLLIAIAFASERPEVLARFAQLDARQQVVAPHLPLFDERETVSFAWLAKYEKELQYVYDKLADEWSRKVFADVLNYKVSGKLQYLFGCATRREEDLRALIKPGPDEIYLDLGAYTGDTLEELGRLANWRWRLALAVEPDRRNCRKLRQTAAALADRGLPVEVYESGIWERAGELSFSDSGGRQSTFVGAAKKSVAVTTVDEVAAGRPVSYIKMDVEGAEAQAIAGGRTTIAKYKPKIFLAAYHYDADIFRLPLLLWELAPDYKIYLRKHPYVPAWELNFICTL